MRGAGRPASAAALLSFGAICRRWPLVGHPRAPSLFGPLACEFHGITLAERANEHRHRRLTPITVGLCTGNVVVLHVDGNPHPGPPTRH